MQMGSENLTSVFKINGNGNRLHFATIVDHTVSWSTTPAAYMADYVPLPQPPKHSQMSHLNRRTQLGTTLGIRFCKGT